MEKEIKEKIIEWEKDLLELLEFTKEEGIDPDRFYSLIETIIKQEKQKLIEEKNIACIREYEKGERNEKQKLVGKILKKINTNYKGRDITICELGDWLENSPKKI